MNVEAVLALAGFALNMWALAQIWFAQLVIYPLFAHVGGEGSRAYHRFYASRIPLPTILPGFACFLLPVPMALLGPTVPPLITAANIACGFIGLFVTVALAIPRHALLERHGKDRRVIEELVRYNWPRTASITAQAASGVIILISAWE